MPTKGTAVQTMMLRLDGLIRRRTRWVLAAWVAVLIVAVPLAMRQGDHLTGGGFAVPGSQSKAVEDSVARDFDLAQRSNLAVVLVGDRGASAAQVRAAIARVGAAADEVKDVALAPAAARAARAQAATPRPIVMPLAVDADEYGSVDVARDLNAALAHDEGGVSAHLVGQGALWAGLQDLSKKDLEAAERTGFPIVLLILLAVFGSLAAASLPLVLGGVSVVVTGALIYGVSHAMEMSVFVTNMASMIGIGVAVDYSLFVLARYREEIHAGRTPDRARAIALATSGVAVAFSGLTVIVSLAGLWLVHANALRSMALGAIMVVAVSVLAASTLLPALIKVMGRRAYTRSRLFTVTPLIFRSHARRRAGSTDPSRPPRIAFWERWTARVTKRPVVSAALAAAVLLALAAPGIGLKSASGALEQFPKDDPVRVAAETAAAVSGPGAGSPVKAIVPTSGMAAARRVLASERTVVRVAPAVRSRDGGHVLLQAQLSVPAESDTAKQAVVRLREALPQGSLAGGDAASLRDFDTQVAGSMWKIVLFVLALSFVVLLVLLRSVVLPLKAAMMNLLSVGAAFGVLHLVFGTVDTITPPLVLAVVFGLSMDYEVFLLSRIRERFNATGDTTRAVAEGLAASAKTITSAALIMVAVFMVFVSTGVPSIQQIGLGTAVAIALDATLVRLVLVPAAMELLGRWNWWLPKPLERLLPRMGFEEAPVGA